MGEKNLSPTFDSYLGGKEILPSSINVKDYCKNRIEEILMLTESLKESPFRGQVFQRLPKHMRRRQMSHHIKRIPQKLRNILVSNQDNEVPITNKRPSRKYRRRPKNLLIDYNRRQKGNIWLETHIWHSKRFHMIEKWGYKLPEMPSNKSVRACYRAATQHCFLHDMSFYTCIELKGEENKLLEGLLLCVSPLCSVTFASKMYKSGLHEGVVVLYHPQCFPYNAVGQVSFLWRPEQSDNKERTIWIFSHPLLHDELVIMFKGLFNLNTAIQNTVDVHIDAKHQENSAVEKEENFKDSNNIKEHVKLQRKNIPFHQTPKFQNDDKSVTMTLLKDTINRFRLTGPLSLAVISSAFDVCMSSLMPSSEEPVFDDDSVMKRIDCMKPPSKRNFSKAFPFEVHGNTSKIQVSDCGKSDTADIEIIQAEEKEKEKEIWWKVFYKNEYNKKCLKIQENFYNNLSHFSNSACLPTRMVFSIIVKDPRLTIPSKRVKCTPDAIYNNFISLSNIDTKNCQSPLWVHEIRDEVSKVQITTSEINYARSKMIVPGSDLGKLLPEEKQARIPLIIIQRSSICGTDLHSIANDFGGGFDILLPAGWAMPVWLSLIYRGARTGGLREWKSLILESNSLNDYFQPDSCSGEMENLDRYEKLRDSYFKRPPSKRHNFFKAGVLTPYYLPWKCLVKDWNMSSEEISNMNGDDNKVNFYVLRNKQKLLELDQILYSLRKCSKQEISFSHSFKKEEMNCLVQVSVECLGKGIPKEFAMICIPNLNDTKELQSKSRLIEKRHIDPNEKIRKMLTLERKKQLKSLSRKRKKNKEQKIAEVKKNSPHCVPIDEYKRKMESLWLNDPQDIKSVRNYPSRTVLGYVVLGGYSFKKAHGLGLGYVTLRGLLHLLKRCYEDATVPYILLRNTASVNYRLGKINICF